MKMNLRKIVFRLLLVSFSTLLVLLACEWYLRTFRPRMLATPLHERIAEARQSLELLQSRNHMLRFNDPRVHHGLYPNTEIKGTRENHSFTARTNDQGFRSPFPFVQSKDAGVHRIAIAGDSFSFGVYVNDTETFPSQLQKNLLQKDPSRKWEVYNFGVPSYSPLIYWQQYRQIIQNHQPDLLIVALDNSDLHDDYSYEQEAKFDAQGNVMSFHSENYTFFMGGVTELLHRETLHKLEAWSTSPSYRLKNWACSHFQTAVLLQDAFNPEIPRLGDVKNDFIGHFRGTDDWSPHWKRTSGYLHRLMEEAKKNHTPIWICYYPYPHQIDENDWSGRTQHGFRVGQIYDTPLQGWVREFTHQEKIPFLDLTGTFRNSSLETFSFKNDPHYLPAGYELMGQALADWILKDFPASPSGQDRK